MHDMTNIRMALRANTSGVNRSGRLPLNPPLNNYLPLDYNLEWGRGLAFAPTME